MSDDPPGARRPAGGDTTAEAEHQATFREVFAVSEFRSLYAANTLTWLGDFSARAAVTVLVYQQTSSVLLSAASFAISYVPWIVGGPILATLADRYPYRRVMILCDLARMALMALLLIPGLPVGLILAVLFLANLATPAAQAAKSAMMPLILDRDRLVVGLSTNATTNNAAQIVGYVAGAAATAAFGAQFTIGANVLAFAASALLIRRGVRARPAAQAAAQHAHLLRETAQGFQLVFGVQVLRHIAIVVFAVTLFVIVPEGLAAAWAAETTTDPDLRGWAQGMIMAASPVGFIVGGVLVGRFVRPSARRTLIRPLATLAPLALVPAVASPPAPVVALMALVAGFALGGVLPTLNGLFVLALPHGYRARAFGVMQGGMQLTQGSAVLITGLLAESLSVPVVVGAWSIGGTLLMVVAAARWPSTDTFNAAIAAAARTAPEPADLPALDPAEPPAPGPGTPGPGTPGPGTPGPGTPGPGTPDPAASATADATRVTPERGHGLMSPPPAAGRMER